PGSHRRAYAAVYAHETRRTGATGLRRPRRGPAGAKAARHDGPATPGLKTSARATFLAGGNSSACRRGCGPWMVSSMSGNSMPRAAGKGFQKLHRKKYCCLMASVLPSILDPLPTAPATGSDALDATPGAEARLRDKHGRAITDLRLSVTDRCNYKCVYCRTGNEGAQYSELPIEEYARVVRLFVSLGVEKVRLTGGEPLLRRGLLELIGEIAAMRPAFSLEPLDIALTTNGHLLAGMAGNLKRAGLNRATVSMDAVDAETFARITRVPGSFERVRDGIRA